ncbi:hypothetical protein K488DRAFT_82242 [Vararia minispora EC-137]|uniref:Uncharacterized protein n=1 Tax=Vararia minispora EC-137 TaxID=1314806 RepID=A0ACB8QXE3_9AGAM|nr:hypothetical protein K488DRAFT_82242 [Vararia minispora EC-137]
MSKPIIFYDFDGTASACKAWNPNCWKVRYILNMKGLPYTTTWLEYPEVEPALKKVSAVPSAKKPDGSDLYTLPAIYDPNTGAALTESEKIAEYLEERYPTPGTPPLFPPKTRALQSGYRDAVRVHTSESVFMLCVQPTVGCLTPGSVEYFVSTRSAMLGSPLDKIAPPGSEAQAKFLKTALDGLSVIASWHDLNETKGLYVMGDQPCFADVALAAALNWVRIVCGEAEGGVWDTLAKADGGRWGKLLGAFNEKWSAEN